MSFLNGYRLRKKMISMTSPLLHSPVLDRVAVICFQSHGCGLCQATGFGQSQ